MSIFAPAACSKCKRQKKGCDKRLPGCSRCISARRECSYTGSQDGSSEGGYPSNKFLGPLEVPLLYIPASVAQTDISELHASTVSYIYAFLASKGETPASVAAEYFRTVGFNIPFISRKRLYACLADVEAMARLDFAALLLSMWLVLQGPPPQREQGEKVGQGVKTMLHEKTKLFLGVLQATGEVSINLVEAGLLLVVYEYGQGFAREAFLSVGTCARMADLLGWHRESQGSTLENLEEGRRLWWRIIMFERLITLDPDFSSNPPSIANQLPQVELPIDDESWDLSPGSLMRNPHPSTTRLQAHATMLLARTIGFISDASVAVEERKHREEVLRGEIMTFAISVVESAKVTFGAHCGALGLNYTTIILLHQRHWATMSIIGTVDEVESPLLDIRRTTQMIIETSENFCKYIEKIDLSCAMPISIHSIYQAALAHINLADKEFAGKEWEDDFRALKGMMGYIRGRWQITRKYLSLIEETYEKKVQDRGVDVVPFPGLETRARWRSSVGI